MWEGQSFDPVELHRAEAKIQYCREGFTHQTLAPMAAVEVIAEQAAMGRTNPDIVAAGADQHVGRIGQRQTPTDADLAIEALLETRDQVLGLGYTGEAVEVVVAGNLVVGEKIEDGIRILRSKPAQNEARGLQIRKGGENACHAECPRIDTGICSLPCLSTAT